jgi:cell wall-associated NlpC family hydrolase
MIEIPTWFDRPERLAALESAAAGWVGTPFAGMSAIKGKGVCCHRLVQEVYREAGAIPEISLPPGKPGWSRQHSTSPMVDWLDGDGAHFVTSLPEPFRLLPGDLVGCRIGRVVHHLAIVLPGGRFVHAVQGHGAIIVPTLPVSLLCRLVRAWRVKP